MFADVASASTRPRLDTLVDGEEDTIKVPLLAQSLARSSAAIPALILAPSRSGTHEVVPPPRRPVAQAAPGYIEDEEPTNKQPEYLRRLAESLLAEGEVANDDHPGSQIVSVEIGVASLDYGWSGSPPTRPEPIQPAALAQLVEPAQLVELWSEAATGEETPGEETPSLPPEAMGLPKRPTMGFYWTASTIAVIGACALTAALLRPDALRLRSPRIFTPTPAVACLADRPTVPPTAPAVQDIRREREPAMASGQVTQVAMKRPSVRRHGDNGIIRRLPF
jgi:hypothetical protein